jgi:hypothetical protein
MISSVSLYFVLEKIITLKQWYVCQSEEIINWTWHEGDFDEGNALKMAGYLMLSGHIHESRYLKR